MRSLAHGPGKFMYWAPENDEILEGGGSFLSGAQLKGCGGLDQFQLGNVTDGLGLRVRRKLLSSLFESISNLSSSEIV